MVSLDDVKASNASIATALPPGLVAVFVGATNGVGETTLKQFAKHASKPRVYFVGRSQEAGDRIAAECKKLNPEGHFTFIKKEASTVRSVDEICELIKSNEKSINLLFLTIGTLQSGTKTAEGLHYPAALSIYARNRFIQNLLPLIQNATSLRRVVSTFVGAMEGEIKWDDFQVWVTSPMASRGHAASITTLSLEHHAKNAPEVSFIHNFPGAVKSGIARGTKGIFFGVIKLFLNVVGPLIFMPTVDAGERHVYLCTSAKYPAAKDTETTAGVPLANGLTVARGTDGKVGSGVYSIDVAGESAKPEIEQVLAQLRNEGAVERVWKNIEGEFSRITNAKADAVQ